MSAAKKGKPSYERTPEHRQLMSERVKNGPPKASGWRHATETREKIRDSWTEEKREAARVRVQKMAENSEWRKSLGSPGESNPNWRGGLAASPYAPGFDRYLKRRIRARDNYTCQLCGSTEVELGYKLSIHHVDYRKDNHCEDNLASTCKRCNSRVNTNESAWFGYFTALADMRRKLGKDVLKLIGRKVISQSVGFIVIDHFPAEIT